MKSVEVTASTLTVSFGTTIMLVFFCRRRPQELAGLAALASYSLVSGLCRSLLDSILDDACRSLFDSILDDAVKYSRCRSQVSRRQTGCNYWTSHRARVL